MKPQYIILLIFLSQIVFAGESLSTNPTTTFGHCAKDGNSVLQVLGSGGPIADDGRASSAYLLWINGKSRFLIDAGGGTFLRFGEAGAQFEDLAHIAISHFHTDHATDLVALLKSGYFSDRKSSLSISGPSGNASYPGLKAHLSGLLSPESGAFAYLSGYLDGSDGLIKLEPIEVDTKPGKSKTIFSDSGSGIEILAMAVPHGPVPTLAFRIEVGEKSIVFSSDQNGNLDDFIPFASNADIMVMHMPVPENTSRVARNLHAPPSIIGNIATLVGAKTLVLSHFMARSLYDIEENLQLIRSRYNGNIRVSHDLDCFTL